MFITLQYAMATPITTPNSRRLINKMSFEGLPVEGDSYLHLGGPYPSGWSVVPI